ncbi:MAG: 16S rRNA (guanine(527)-N(7))-methyltransferase RsmG [Deltaproteobacteria bacterium]|nr:16S rRNA (guanine(527)-N(7))-methyltransferase RsmG [Deltaproteobacteria bacterium]
MDEKGLKKLLIDGAFELGVSLDQKKADQFLTFLKELKAWNKKINLTAITDDKDIIIKHFLDSLTVFGILRRLSCKKLLDIGSGAGFPGIPLKIASPDLSITMMDSVERKAHFIRHIIRTLNLPGEISAISARAEDPYILEGHRSAFDSVVSRALSGLREFIDIAMPYLSEGGAAIAIKGPAVLKELEGMAGARGISAPEVFEVKVPFSDRRNNIIIVRRLPFS